MVPAIAQAAIRHAMNRMVIRGDDLLRVEKGRCFQHLNELR